MSKINFPKILLKKIVTEKYSKKIIIFSLPYFVRKINTHIFGILKL
jgi:hypothetical protein